MPGHSHVIVHLELVKSVLHRRSVVHRRSFVKATQRDPYAYRRRCLPCLCVMRHGFFLTSHTERHQVGKQPRVCTFKDLLRLAHARGAASSPAHPVCKLAVDLFLTSGMAFRTI